MAETTWRGRWDQWWVIDEDRTAAGRARRRAVRRGVAAGFAMIVVGSVVRLPFLVMSPGPTYNTLGEVDGTPVIEVSGAPTFPATGQLDMTTVAERGGSSNGVTLGEALLGWVSSRQSVLPRESLYGPDTTGEEAAEQNDQLFALSQSDSIAAAMGELGIATTRSVVVTTVSGGSPADGIVEAGDEVVSVDGRTVAEPADVGRLVRQRSVGDTVVLTVLRADPQSGGTQRLALDIVAGTNAEWAAEAPDAGPTPYLGIGVGTRYEAPFDIDFTLDNVGGPSAGMMFSLALVDLLTEGSMTGGAHVAGTGTIDPDGNVGPIGGIRHKLVGARDAGAAVFLAPEGNCDEVVGHVPDGLTVVPVATLDAARETVERWAADPSATFPTCPASG